MIFESKKGVLYFSVIWGTILVILLGLFLQQMSPIMLTIYFLLGFTIITVLCWIWFRTNYKIENHVLLVNFGPFKIRINIHEIRKIKKVKNAWTSPGLSIERLEITYGFYQSTYISPKNEDLFIKELLKLNSKIHFE